ncbi:hypothetical protein GCM10008967_41920 [Bacillus carboniphilus]|uniref:M23ase beta-sheet core domain-containing protein n=1 Tax=Bacillus carboniphilus TaxID=86663 RepID=A0ABN0WUU9_9BACI
MKDYIRRLLIVALMAFFISLLFVGGRAEASEVDTEIWLWPADGVLSDHFGSRHGYHYGIDIAGQWGSHIHSVYDGKVIKSYYSYSYGNVIFIEHPSGYVTVYAHLARRLKDVGETVSSGEIIGTMGTTGRSTGVHLHFEVHTSEWNYGKTNVIDPSTIYGNLKIGEQTSVESRMLYVQNVLHERKKNILLKEGLWQNLDSSESANEWIEIPLQSVTSNKTESFHFILINREISISAYNLPNTYIDFSGLFLMVALIRRKGSEGQLCVPIFVRNEKVACIKDKIVTTLAQPKWVSSIVLKIQNLLLQFLVVMNQYIRTRLLIHRVNVHGT